jgi:type IV pili sensor histidine kinase/response regulator
MQYVVHYFALMILPLAVSLSSRALAELTTPGVHESRYMVTQLGPTEPQQDLLQAIVIIQVPPHITTVGNAIEYVVRPYGFQMLLQKDIATEQSLLASLPLPETHRTLGPITLVDALKVLGGEAFNLVVNPVNRTVSYVLNPDYRQYVTADEIEQAHQKWLRQQEQARFHTYGPVKPGETLSRISIALGLHGMTLDQHMVQLYQANPDAFYNNMNGLKVGVMLSIPPADLKVMSVREAIQFVDEHHRRWKQGVTMP